MYSRPKGSKGKFSADCNTEDFWKWYYKEYEGKKIPYSKGKALYKDMMKRLITYTIDTGNYFLIPNLGFFCCVYRKRKILDENNQVRMKLVGINWKESKELWKQLYPDKTPEEIKADKSKPYVRFKNKSTLGTKLYIQWIKVKSTKYSFNPVTSVEAELGRKANAGAIGISSAEDFKILTKTLKRSK